MQVLRWAGTAGMNAAESNVNRWSTTACSRARQTARGGAEKGLRRADHAADGSGGRPPRRIHREPRRTGNLARAAPRPAADEVAADPRGVSPLARSGQAAGAPEEPDGRGHRRRAAALGGLRAVLRGRLPRNRQYSLGADAAAVRRRKTGPSWEATAAARRRPSSTASS